MPARSTRAARRDGAEIDRRDRGERAARLAVAALAADPLGHRRAGAGDDDDFGKSVAGHGLLLVVERSNRTVGREVVRMRRSTLERSASGPKASRAPRRPQGGGGHGSQSRARARASDRSAERSC